MWKMCLKLRFLCKVALLVSLYGFYVEYKVEENESYRAYCDLLSSVSCTDIFSTPYRRFFGIIYTYHRGLPYPQWDPANTFIAIVYYSILFGSTYLKPKRFIYIMQLNGCIMSCILSLYLNYIIYFILGKLCVLSALIFTLNILSLLIIAFNWKTMLRPI